MPDAESIITALGLQPHPEGGHYAETWRAQTRAGERPSGTAIYYLLRAGEHSCWHRVDAAEVWHWDENQACHATTPLETHRTKKVPRVLIKYEATEEHPAQTDVWHEDVVVGFWKTIKYSGAVPAQRRKELLNRVETLQRAVKYAREEANSIEVEDVKVGQKFLDWIFA